MQGRPVRRDSDHCTYHLGRLATVWQLAGCMVCPEIRMRDKEDEVVPSHIPSRCMGARAETRGRLMELAERTILSRGGR